MSALYNKCMINNLVIIDDDPIITEMLADMAKVELNVPAETFSSAEEFFSRKNKPQNCVYLVDWNLPGKIQGPEIIKKIRLYDRISPVFMISGNNDSKQIIEGLRSGADDYLVKPFMSDELLEKIRNASMRTIAITDNMMNVGIKLIPEADLIIKDGEKVGLTSREFQVFRTLYEEPNKVHSRNKIVMMFKDNETTERNIDVLVYSLRKKITNLGLEIDTVRSQGYRLNK